MTTNEAENAKQKGSQNGSEKNSNNMQYEILKEDYPNFDLSFKIIVIGNSGKKIYFNIYTKWIGVGKSALSIMATKHTFQKNYIATVGFEFFSFNIKLKNKVIRLQIWDTCGQEIYRSLVTNFYRNCSLAIIVYAIDE